MIDLKGKKFGRLTVLSKYGTASSCGGLRWRCRCVCGTIKIIRSIHLRKGHTRSCGCYQKERTSAVKVTSLLGRKFGRLIVISRCGSTLHGKAKWRCQCDCGGVVIITSGDLINGHSQSCGCYHKDMSRNAVIKRMERSKYCASKSCSMFLDLIETRFGILICREYRLCNRLFDGQVNTILIEIDSEYWHSKKKSKAIDVIKDHIALSNGFLILRMVVNSKDEIYKQFNYYQHSMRKAFILHKIIKDEG